jgi:hypothetical protein
MRKHLRHLGSTLAIVLGFLTFVAGISQRTGLMITGPVILLGAYAYRSAKKRRLGEVPNTKLRFAVELAAMVLLIAAIVLQNDLKRLIAEDPFPNFAIPLWVVVAYVVAIWPRKNRPSTTETAKEARQVRHPAGNAE